MTPKIIGTIIYAVALGLMVWIATTVTLNLIAVQNKPPLWDLQVWAAYVVTMGLTAFVAGGGIWRTWRG